MNKPHKQQQLGKIMSILGDQDWSKRIITDWSKRIIT